MPSEKINECINDRILEAQLLLADQFIDSGTREQKKDRFPLCLMKAEDGR